ncbi:hypothetical protein J5I95_15835 [Candidatus Poribacteria bacterium]|nr:hypothetical protein [Candidatus Poribacteria bacterium]
MRQQPLSQSQGIDFLENNKEEIGQSFFLDTDDNIETFLEDTFNQVAKHTYKFAVIIVCEERSREDLEMLLKELEERGEKLPRKFGTYMQLFPRVLFNIARDSYNQTEAHKWEQLTAL